LLGIESNCRLWGWSLTTTDGNEEKTQIKKGEIGFHKTRQYKFIVIKNTIKKAGKKPACYVKGKKELNSDSIRV